MKMPILDLSISMPQQAYKRGSYKLHTRERHEAASHSIAQLQLSKTRETAQSLATTKLQLGCAVQRLVVWFLFDQRLADTWNT